MNELVAAGKKLTLKRRITFWTTFYRFSNCSLQIKKFFKCWLMCWFTLTFNIEISAANECERIYLMINKSRTCNWKSYWNWKRLTVESKYLFSFETHKQFTINAFFVFTDEIHNYWCVNIKNRISCTIVLCQ